MMNSMIITGLITEYNPFHLGHLHHIQEARRLTQCDVLIAVMSGQFVQRGEPALVDKWKRAQAALDAGVDLVIELPFVACVQDASRFAKASVALLNHAGCTHLVFGSESNDLAFLQSVADLPIQVDNLKESLRQGLSYPKAYNLVNGPFEPNDILGIAYLKALQATKITPLTIQRTNSYHSTQIDTQIASATAIRKAVLDQKDVGLSTPMAEVLKLSELNHLSKYYELIRFKLLTTPLEVLRSLFLMEEGLETHLVNMAKRHADFEVFLTSSISKRYTRSRIQRTLVHLLTHTTKQQVKDLPPMHTLRILGMNAIGRAYLKRLEPEGFKVASRFNQVNAKYRAMEVQATLVYASVLSDRERERLIQRELEGPIIHS